MGKLNWNDVVVTINGREVKSQSSITYEKIQITETYDKKYQVVLDVSEEEYLILRDKMIELQKKL